MPTESYWQTNAPMLLLAGVAIAWYAGVRALCDTFARNPSDGASRVGFVYSLPVLLFGVCGVAGGQPQFALGAIFASSVAALTLVAGLLICTSAVIKGTGVRDWARLLPTTAILLLAGFSGRLGLFHAAILFVQGGMVLWVVKDSDEISHEMPEESVGRSDGLLFGVVQCVVAATLLAAASWAAWKALTDLQGKFSNVPAHSLTSLLVAPAMVLPMLGTGMTFAREGRTKTAVSSLVTFVQINTCVLFPLLIAASVVRNTMRVEGGTLTENLTALLDPDNSMLLPAGVWRIDVVFLMFCSLMLLPAGWRQWSLGKTEGAILSCLYIVYLFLITLVR